MHNPARKEPVIRRLTLPVRPWLAAAILLACAHLARAAEERYVAWLRDGTRLTASTLPSWPIPGASYRFENRDLLANDNPVRFLRDLRAATTLRPPFMVLANGDILGGTPLELEPDSGQEVPRLRVQLESPLMPVSGTGISVRTDRIQRIVLAPVAESETPPPGSVVLADGRRLVARSIRWRQYGLAFLTADGLVDALFSDLRDVVFPRVDAIAALLDDSLWASAEGAGALARFQTTGGSVITAARASREREQTRGRGRLTSAVYYYVQPAWADQPLALPEQELTWCGYRQASEAPLSLLPAETLATRRILGHHTPWQANRGPDGAWLAAANLESDLGIAAHAHSAIAFELPAGAKSLSLAMGLDRAVGSGGCVRCKVVAEEEDGKVLFDSGILQGRDGRRFTGPLDVHGLKRIVLVAECAADGRPAGADPLDIRDQVVWLSPLVALDESLMTPVRRAQAIVPGASEWDLPADSWKDAQLTQRWNPMNNNWDTVVGTARGKELRLSRTIEVSPRADVLELLTSCPTDLNLHHVALRVGGKEIPWTNNTDRNQLRQWVTRYGRTRNRDDDDENRRTDQLAYWWDLKPWRGQTVSLELTIGSGSDARGEIAWRGLAVRSAVAAGASQETVIAPQIPLAAAESVDSGRASRNTKDASPREPVRFLGQVFADGYNLPRNTALSFRIQSDFVRFVALAGCSQQVAGPVRVLIDDQTVWERPAITALTPAEQIDVRIPPGAKVLTLEHGDGANYGLAAFAATGFMTQ